MAICINCKYSKAVPGYKNRYYCDKKIYEFKDKHNTSDFGCVRGGVK